MFPSTAAQQGPSPRVPSWCQDVPLQTGGWESQELVADGAGPGGTTVDGLPAVFGLRCPVHAVVGLKLPRSQLDRCAPFACIARGEGGRGPGLPPDMEHAGPLCRLPPNLSFQIHTFCGQWRLKARLMVAVRRRLAVRGSPLACLLASSQGHGPRCLLQSWLLPSLLVPWEAGL